MKKNEEQMRSYLEKRVDMYLKPLIVDVMRKQPDDVLDFIENWCKTKGREIKDTADAHVDVKRVSHHYDEIKKSFMKMADVPHAEKSPEEITPTKEVPPIYHRKGTPKEPKEPVEEPGKEERGCKGHDPKLPNPHNRFDLRPTGEDVGKNLSNSQKKIEIPSQIAEKKRDSGDSADRHNRFDLRPLDPKDEPDKAEGECGSEVQKKTTPAQENKLAEKIKEINKNVPETEAAIGVEAQALGKDQIPPEAKQKQDEDKK